MTLNNFGGYCIFIHEQTVLKKESDFKNKNMIAEIKNRWIK